ncbi:quercetin 2,3-dioxygenase PA3240 [Cupriavidus necator N-1]|jgi:redox-sensitive bicupin YhaK (pirin superfamily)|uniref:Quercetin 2,3-dioxygenase PA3240 n=1 Tax=Cupriavidus necator (strain ATCC 43291 / DSM 13513 / CCUG 52238 / LMG 8453 / N-1) TaxID=1042878 RepID=G0EYY6_CUPNN|nr:MULTISPECIES: pirin family protein [Cupriavidus]AEI76251.1 quercetin 2,3-dioxygenase PA3240 [Cupriavidus necator N-1]KAI3609951.1 Pirin [Cupriavidus necator H850]MDX6011625.1 pirin family protein [Cupriavidus necator]QUN29252.1 pirin family protein [Cupriavidus sp. KK10]
MDTLTTTLATVPAAAAETVQRSRAVDRVVRGIATSDGAGVKLTRVLTQNLQRRLDPFLMLDAFGTDSKDDYIGGFPDHPHRGFETITYMLAGRMRHRDSAGNEGLLQNGGAQWMVAGAGVVHSEMPEQEDGRMEGFQLWLNLPAADKMTAPWYRDLPAAEIPTVALDNGGTVRVLAGATHGVAGAITRPVTEPVYLDVHLPAGQTFAQALPVGHNAFVYVYRGEVSIGNGDDRAVIEAQRMGVLDNAGQSDGVIVRAEADARFLLIAGQPLNEPIAQYGPFVMNTQEQIYQTLADFRDGRFATSAAAIDA